MLDIGFDVLTELKLEPDESFNWENKASSLYCLVPGNVSACTRTVVQTLSHLANHYQGVFYIPGQLEYGSSMHDERYQTEELQELTSTIPGVIMLYNNVVIVDGIAVLGINGWNDGGDETKYESILETQYRLEDTLYLRESLSKLQKHVDVKKVILMSNGVPNIKLYCGEHPPVAETQIPLDIALQADTEKKVSHWVFGSYNKGVDVVSDNINYINNPYIRKTPYWAKRITLSV